MRMKYWATEFFGNDLTDKKTDKYARKQALTDVYKVVKVRWAICAARCASHCEIDIHSDKHLFLAASHFGFSLLKVIIHSSFILSRSIQSDRNCHAAGYRITTILSFLGTRSCRWNSWIFGRLWIWNLVETFSIHKQRRKTEYQTFSPSRTSKSDLFFQNIGHPNKNTFWFFYCLMKLLWNFDTLTDDFQKFWTPFQCNLL